MGKTLIISPHLDDECLSASSFLLDPTEDLNDKVFVFYGTNKHSLVSEKILKEENAELCEWCGVTPILSRFNVECNTKDRVPVVQMIDEFEDLIKQLKPDIVVLPSPSYNQDHEYMRRAALTALRPHDQIPFVNRVLVAEEVDVFGTMREQELFKPTFFRPIDIKKKIELVNIYQSQIRGHRSSEMIKAIAKVRGLQCNEEYAEAFEVLRWK
jgi:N-acetylglucosamine malate deacetylase 1